MIRSFRRAMRVRKFQRRCRAANRCAHGWHEVLDLPGSGEVVWCMHCGCPVLGPRVAA